MISWLLALLLFLQQHPQSPAEADQQRKQVEALVAQILRLAASEPAVYGIDTRLKTADALASRYPKIARKVLEDARGELAGIAAADEQDHMRVRLVAAFAPLDLEEAERLTGSFRRGGDHDYVAEAYDQLYRYFEKNSADALRMIHHGLAAGAFRMISASRQLEEWKSKDPEAAAGLFAEIMAAFPAESPHSEDVEYLLEQLRQILKLNRALAVQAIDRSLSATTSQSLRMSRDADPKLVRERLLREIGAEIDTLDPGLFARYKKDRPELDLPPPPKLPAEKEEKKSDEVEPNYAELPYSEALTRARKQEDLANRAGALIEISRREDLTAAQRTSIALEALGVTAKMPLLDDRLTGLAMISRDFARRGEMANAALAAQILSETFGKVCDCPSAMCVHDKEKIDCMQDVESFAEYLDEFKISPESMNLQNISLEARLLVLKLFFLVNPKAAQERRTLFQ